MAKKIDWLDFAHEIDRERELMQDRLPEGMMCTLSLGAYGYGAAHFSVTVQHKEIDVVGHGSGRTPAKALEEARRDFQKDLDKKQRVPRLVETKPLSLPSSRSAS